MPISTPNAPTMTQMINGISVFFQKIAPACHRISCNTWLKPAKD
jgi:hypothetical protein